MRRRMGIGVLCIASSAGLAQVGFEVSEDGLLRASLLRAGDTSATRAAAGAPFGSEPDWQNDIRRQVGGLKIADMNGDGWNDLVVGIYQSNSYPPYPDYHDVIYFNTGGELEAQPSWIADDETHTGDVLVGDINGDGFNDYFAISGGAAFRPVRIYFGNQTGISTSAGWIASPPRPGWATSGVLFDIDGDGDLDAVTTNQGVSPDPYRPMHFFRNTGSGLETSPSWVSAEESIQNGLSAGDFDGDGDLDIGVAKWVNFESGIYRNNAGTLETTPIWTTGDDGTDKGSAFGDIDANGWPDFGLGHDEPTRVYGNDGGNLAIAWESDAPFYGPQEVHIVDVDDDGDLDFAEVHFSDGRAHIYLNEGGHLSVQPSWTYDAPTVASAMAFGDINGDGITDLAIGYSGDVSVRVFYGRPPACAADLDGDGDADADDFFLYLDAFATGNTGVCDLDADGDCDADDFFGYLDQFSQGC